MTTVRCVLGLSVLLLVGVPMARAADVLTNDGVVTMVNSGLGDDVIIGKIRVSQTQFDLSTQALLDLKSRGVSEAIIKAMLDASAPATSARPRTLQDVTRETQGAIALYQAGKVDQALTAFDKLIEEQPNDDQLKVWKALALLELARAKRDANVSGYKPLVVQAYAILQPLGRTSAKNADWNFATAKAFWLNDRPNWAKRAAGKAIDLRADFAEPHLLLGDLAYDDDVDAMNASSSTPRVEIAKQFVGQVPRKEYEKVLAMPNLRPALQAEAFYKLGVVSAELLKKNAAAREYWERAAATDPVCRYGVMAQEKLKMVPAK